MLRNAQVFGSRQARSAHGLDSSEVGEVWRPDGACSEDPDLWFESGARHWALAAHVCLRHCPVLEQCGNALLAEMRQGVRPRDGVVAGVRFNTVGRPRATDQSKVRCTLCRKPPRDDAAIEADIAAYARRKGVDAPDEPAPRYRRLRA
jgi:hypothetical protein